jgi:hypothetical protein
VRGGVVVGSLLLFLVGFNFYKSKSPARSSHHSVTTPTALSGSRPLSEKKVIPLPDSLPKKKVEPLLDQLAQELDQQKISISDFVRKEEAGETNDLPPAIQDLSRGIKLAIRKAQQEVLKEDGVSEDFFTPMKTSMSESLQRKADAVDTISLSEDVQSFVADRAQHSEITDEDLKNLSALCGSDQDCLNKSMKIWMDANHLFTDEQLAMVEEK